MAAMIPTASIDLQAIPIRSLRFAPGSDARAQTRPFLLGADARTFLRDIVAESGKDKTRGIVGAAIDATLGAPVPAPARVDGVSTKSSGHQIAVAAGPVLTRVVVPSINSNAPGRVDFESGGTSGVCSPVCRLALELGAPPGRTRG
jgi:hypothetical protein